MSVGYSTVQYRTVQYSMQFTYRHKKHLVQNAYNFDHFSSHEFIELVSKLLSCWTTVYYSFLVDFDIAIGKIFLESHGQEAEYDIVTFDLKQIRNDHPN